MLSLWCILVLCVAQKAWDISNFRPKPPGGGGLSLEAKNIKALVALYLEKVNLVGKRHEL